jgi:integrase
VNMTVELLYRIMRLGVELGTIPFLPFDLNPVLGGPVRKAELPKKIRLPSSPDMQCVFAEMRTAGQLMRTSDESLRAYVDNRCQESAEFAEFMAYSGARVGEARSFSWEDELKDSIIIRGTKTNSSRDREVPKIAAMRSLLERMKARRKLLGEACSGLAFEIKQCRECMEQACKRAGVPRLTHHDLRHYFATICIESGTDIPTVSRWMGHSDGGVLAMKTYGHLRQDHSFQAAAKVMI